MPLSPTAHALAQVRRHIAPEVEGPDTKWVRCRVCGEQFLEWVGRHHRKCINCAAEASSLSHQKPRQPTLDDYLRTVRGAYNYWRAEAERLGLLTADE